MKSVWAEQYSNVDNPHKAHHTQRSVKSGKSFPQHDKTPAYMRVEINDLSGS